MRKENRNILIVLAVLVILFVGAYGGVRAYSGVNPPFTVINSGSMMHSSDSQIGIIDTGDMILVKDPDTVNIKTYVDGAKSGYRTFGEYGDVIVYKKPNQNIIHRAMIFMELKSKSGETQVWNIESLKGYEKWDITTTSPYNASDSKKDICWNEDKGELTITSAQSFYYFWLTDVGYAGINVSINLHDLGDKHNAGDSGYLTKGDNASTNTKFDQASGIMHYQLVSKDIIKSVAVFEIPWLGCIKLYLNGNSDSVPSNSTICLIVSFIAIIGLIFLINFLIDRMIRRKG